MIASAVQRTRRMRFGNYVNALSFHHPLRLAAEAAMLDNLARGRFDFGVGVVCSFGNLSHAQVCRSLELFTDAAIRPRPAERIGA
jgi:Luciferase-like monooxygenase